MLGPLIQLDCPHISHYFLQSFLGLFSSWSCYRPSYALYWVLGFLLGLGMVFDVLIISLDFVVGLPTFRRHTTILVGVDRFSKGIHLGMLPTHHTSHIVVVLFMEIVGKIHRIPRSLVSDRDPLFISCFWQELFRLSDTHLRMSYVYHSQTNRQTKVLNHVTEQYLWAFVHKKPSSWGKFWNWVEWSYNTSWHSVYGASPYEITFGKKPFNIPQYIARTSNLDVVDKLLTNREVIFT